MLIFVFNEEWCEALLSILVDNDFCFNKAVSEARTKVLASETNAVKIKIGGLKWTRTIDLPLIRRTL